MRSGFASLGADPGRVRNLILGQGLILSGVGLLIGLALSFALSRFTASLLYGVSTTDVFTFIAVPLVLVSVSAMAVAVPAWRASRVTPMEALRFE